MTALQAQKDILFYNYTRIQQLVDETEAKVRYQRVSDYGVGWSFYDLREAVRELGQNILNFAEAEEEILYFPLVMKTSPEVNTNVCTEFASSN